MSAIQETGAPAAAPVRLKRAFPIVTIIAATIMATIVLLTILAPLLPFDPYKQDLTRMLMGPSWENPFGADMLGRDIFSRVLWGGGPPLLVGFAATIAAMIVGVIAGLFAGYRQGPLDALVGRIADIQLSIPGLILALLILVFLGSSITNLIIVIAFESWPMHYRVVRSHVMAVRNLSFIEAARLGGLRERQIVMRHVLPSVLPLLAVTGTANFSHAVLAEAGLSFLGIGVQPPTPDWGMMVAEGQSQLAASWWMSIFPGLALVAVLWSSQVIGDWISDRFSVRNEAL